LFGKNPNKRIGPEIVVVFTDYLLGGNEK